jgi:hypothetical protein
MRLSRLPGGSRGALCLVGFVAALALGSAAAAAVATGGGVSWGGAIEVPGSAAINIGSGGAAAGMVNAVSCPSTGSCAAGGSYTDSSGNAQAFVVDERSGVWGKAIEVPGTAAFNLAGTAQAAGVSCPSGASCQGVNSVSCVSTGNCAAGGEYTDDAGSDQAFVVDEKNGVWGDAVEVPGTAALNVGGGGSVLSVSCASAGNCGAAGSYLDGSGTRQAFVVDETSGAWGSAIEVPGTAALNTAVHEDTGAAVNSISCRAAGNCTAGGYYETHLTGTQAFMVDEKGGVWGTAREVRGNASFNTNYFAAVSSVSCASVGNCTAGGGYTPRGEARHAFVIFEKKGVWGRASEVAPHASFERYGASVSSISCPSAGNCAVGGSFEDATFGWHAFVVAERSGSLRAAIEVPGTQRPRIPRNHDWVRPFAMVTSVSCASAYKCAVGGIRLDSAFNQRAFLETEQKNGAWGKAVALPGVESSVFGYLSSVSCAHAGKCVAAGFYDDPSLNAQQAFVTAP